MWNPRNECPENKMVKLSLPSSSIKHEHVCTWSPKEHALQRPSFCTVSARARTRGGGGVTPEWRARTAAGVALEGSPTLLTFHGQHGTRQGAARPHLRRWQDLSGPISDILWHQGASQEILHGTLFRDVHDIRVYIWPSMSVKFITTYSFNNSMAFALSS